MTGPGWIDPRPRHQQIAADLRAAILSGDLPPGGRLPSTAQMMEQYAVTGNQTIQNALGILRQEGYVGSQVGRGTFVRDRPPLAITPAAFTAPVPAGAAYPWMTEAARRGHAGSVRLLDVAEVAPPHEVAAAFDLLGPDEAKVVRRTLLMLLDDEPAELAHTHYPVEIARGTALADHRRVKGGSPRLLADAGLPPDHAVDLVSARPPTTEEFAALKLTAEVPILRTFRVVYTAEGQPVEATVMAKVGSKYGVTYQVRTSATP